MIYGRPIPPYLRIALIVVLGYLVVTQLLHYALFPIVLGMVAWGGYQIYRAERRMSPTSSPPKSMWARRAKRPLKIVKSIRLDPEKDLRVPKDWR